MSATLKGRLSFWFTIVCLVPLTLLTTVIYFHRVKVAKEFTSDKLTAISSQRQEQIVGFLDDIAGDISTIAGNAYVINSAQSLLHPSTKDRHVDANTSAIIRGYLNGHKKSGEISIVSKTGTILFSTAGERYGTSIEKPEIVASALRDQIPVYGDILLSARDRTPCMDIAVPIKSSGDGYLPAALVLHLNLRQTIYRIVENRTGLGQTGELLLVNRDVMALSELRWMQGAVLKSPLNGQPAQLAAKGQSGYIEAIDYRGEKVLASYTYIPELGWGLVCKQDTKEIYAPLKGLLYVSYGLVALISSIVCFFAFVLARSISQPIMDLAQTSVKIGAGDFGSRIEPKGTEEMRQLAASFNASPGDFEHIRELGIRYVVQKGDVDQQELLRRVYEMRGIDTLFNNDRLLLPQSAASISGRALGDGPILVVEDNPDNLSTIKAVLGKEYLLVEATDGEAGLALARSGSPSLILLDMQLPHKDGMTVLLELKSDPATARHPGHRSHRKRHGRGHGKVPSNGMFRICFKAL